VENITTIAFLFKHQNWAFTIIHETNAMIDSVTEYVEKIAKAARETPLDVVQHLRPLEQLAHEEKQDLTPFLFVGNSVILLIWK